MALELCRSTRAARIWGMRFSLLLGIAACSAGTATSADDAGMLRISTSQATYSPGDSVYLTIENVGLAVIRYFPCPVLVDRASGIAWTEVGVLAGFAADDCDLSVLPLRPGETKQFQAHLDDTLPTGTYRLRFEELRAGDGTKLPLQSRVTNAFSIQ